MAENADVSAAIEQASGRSARFDGRLGALGVLMLRNLLFSILTFGIYRFWGRTHVRRFVWRHTTVLDDALEYLGTGGELFIGFLIAVAVLLPVFAAYSVLQFVFTDGSQVALIALEVLYYLALFFLIQIAIHRMRRYRLTRTAWRGVRFGLGGSSLAYARVAFGYSLLTAATLGFAYPWLRVATLKYFASHAYFGTASVALTPNARWLFRRWLAVVAPLMAILALFIALNLEMFENIRFFFEEGYDRAGGRAMLSLSFWPLHLLSDSASRLDLVPRGRIPAHGRLSDHWRYRIRFLRPTEICILATPYFRFGHCLDRCARRRLCGLDGDRFGKDRGRARHCGRYCDRSASRVRSCYRHPQNPAPGHPAAGPCLRDARNLERRGAGRGRAVFGRRAELRRGDGRGAGCRRVLTHGPVSGAVL